MSNRSFKSWSACQEQRCFVDCCLGAVHHNRRMLLVASKAQQSQLMLSVEQPHRLQAFIRHRLCCIYIHCTKALLRVKQLDQKLDQESDSALIDDAAVWTEELPVLRLYQLLEARAVMQARSCPLHSAGFSLPQGLLYLAAWSLQCQQCTVSASPCACMTSEQLFVQTAS